MFALPDGHRFFLASSVWAGSVHLAPQLLMIVYRGEGCGVIWPEDAAGLGSRVTVKGFGIDELSLVAQHVTLVGQGQHIVGMVGAHRALHAMGVFIGQFLGGGRIDAAPAAAGSRDRSSGACRDVRA